MSESVWGTVRCENTLVKTKLGLQRGPRTNFKTGWAIKSCERRWIWARDERIFTDEEWEADAQTKQSEIEAAKALKQ